MPIGHYHQFETEKYIYHSLEDNKGTGQVIKYWEHEHGLDLTDTEVTRGDSINTINTIEEGRFTIEGLRVTTMMAQDSKNRAHNPKTTCLGSSLSEVCFLLVSPSATHTASLSYLFLSTPVLSQFSSLCLQREEYSLYKVGNRCRKDRGHRGIPSAPCSFFAGNQTEIKS